MIASLGDNQMFGAGFGLFAMGMAATMAKKGAQVGMVLFRRHYMTTVEVTCKDTSYPWLLGWMTARGARNTQHLSVDTRHKVHESGKVATHYEFEPSVGVHFMKHGKTWIRVERTREQRMNEPWETVMLTAFGKKKSVFVDILEDARQLALSEVSGKTLMYVVRGTDWVKFGHPRQRRPLASVVLDAGVGEAVVKDVREFMTSESWYRERGIPYRRGYLLHGPPGCGKTSFIAALAGELEYSICVLNLSDRTMGDDRLAHRLADAPENSIILLEDIDAAFVSRELSAEAETAYQGANRLTFSGLLNAIDGVTSTEGRIVFMTTNYFERLDPALIRPGRVDYIEQISHCSHHQLLHMFAKFFPLEAAGKAAEFANAATELGVPLSAAQVSFTSQNTPVMQLQGTYSVHYSLMYEFCSLFVHC